LQESKVDREGLGFRGEVMETKIWFLVVIRKMFKGRLGVSVIHEFTRVSGSGFLRRMIVPIGINSTNVIKEECFERV